MSEIVLTRIDDRLIHGQVFVQWCGYVDADMIVVANNEAAASHFKQGLMDMAVPDAVETRYWSIDETAVRFRDMGKDYRILLVVKNPEDLAALIKAGLPVKQVNIGNLPMAEGKVQKTPSVAVSQADREAFQTLKDMGCLLEIRRLPQSEPEDLSRIFA